MNDTIAWVGVSDVLLLFFTFAFARYTGFTYLRWLLIAIVVLVVGKSTD